MDPKNYNFKTLDFENKLLPKGFTEGRGGGRIQQVVIHHAAGKGRYNVWNTLSKRSLSSHYIIEDNYVLQSVWDSNTARTAGHTWANQNSIQVETCNSTLAPHYQISDQSFETLAKWIAGVHFKHIKKSPSTATVKKHKDYKATSCPGPYIEANWGRLIQRAQAHYNQMVKPAPAPKPVPPPPPPKPAPQPETENVYHVVQKGESLWKLAQVYLGDGNLYKTIMQRNGLKSEVIHPGQRLLIRVDPKTSWVNYTIKRGDSLSKIASQYGTTWQKLASKNNIKNPNLIHVGHNILVPRK